MNCLQNSRKNMEENMEYDVLSTHHRFIADFDFSLFEGKCYYLKGHITATKN